MPESMWKFGLGRYLLFFRTPWFGFMISSGSPEYTHDAYWYGLRAYWNPRISPKEGEYIFLSQDEFLSFMVTE